jgi:hypothetical protein
VLDTVMTASLQDVQEADEVEIDVGMRFECVATLPGGEIDDAPAGAGRTRADFATIARLP